MSVSKPNNPDLEFIESTHTYLYNGVIIPSVTQIMRVSSEEYYSNISESRLRIAADRGTRVHQAIHEFEVVGVRTNDPEVIPYLTEYIIAKARYKFKPIWQEFLLTNGQYAGTLDMLAELNGQQVVVDLKATSKFNKELAEIQLAGYVELCEFNGIHIDSTYILHMNSDKHKLHKVTPNYDEWERLKNEVMCKMSSQ